MTPGPGPRTATAGAGTAGETVDRAPVPGPVAARAPSRPHPGISPPAARDTTPDRAVADGPIPVSRPLRHVRIGAETRASRGGQAAGEAE